MVSKRKQEERRFQMELVKIEVDLQNYMAWYIGILALTFSGFWYFRETGELVYQGLMLVLMFLTILVLFPLLFKMRKKSFKDLEQKFITGKKET